jgi:hypothetical protein
VLIGVDMRLRGYELRPVSSAAKAECRKEAQMRDDDLKLAD